MLSLDVFHSDPFLPYREVLISFLLEILEKERNAI